MVNVIFCSCRVLQRRLSSIYSGAKIPYPVWYHVSSFRSMHISTHTIVGYTAAKKNKDMLLCDLRNDFTSTIGVSETNRSNVKTGRTRCVFKPQPVNDTESVSKHTEKHVSKPVRSFHGQKLSNHLEKRIQTGEK